MYCSQRVLPMPCWCKLLPTHRPIKNSTCCIQPAVDWFFSGKLPFGVFSYLLYFLWLKKISVILFVIRLKKSIGDTIFQSERVLANNFLVTLLFSSMIFILIAIFVLCFIFYFSYLFLHLIYMFVLLFFPINT
jgi:hypothetical protein